MVQDSFLQKDKAESPKLEQQIEQLERLGIVFRKPTEEVRLELTAYNSADFYVEEPYRRLLHELSNRLKPLSPQILSFDVESAESADVYESYIARMIELAQGKIEMPEVQGTFDPTEAYTDISFTYQGTTHELSAENQGDWLDMNVLGQVARIVEQPDCRFIHNWEDQTVILICCNDAARDELAKLTGGTFTPLI